MCLIQMKHAQIKLPLFSFWTVHIDEQYLCAADFSLLNLPKGKSLGRSKPATNS